LASFSFNDFGFRDYYNESSSFGDPEEAVLEKVLKEYLDKIEKNIQEIRLLWFFYSQIHNPPFFITNTSGRK